MEFLPEVRQAMKLAGAAGTERFVEELYLTVLCRLYYRGSFAVVGERPAGRKVGRHCSIVK